METRNSLQNTSTTSRVGLPTTIRRLVAGLGLCALLFSACGSDGDPVTTGSGDTEDSGNIGEIGDASLSIGDGESSDLADKAGELTQPVELPMEVGDGTQAEITADALFGSGVSGDIARDDIFDPKPWSIDNATVSTDDDSVLHVTYEAGNPPCTQAYAEAVETSDKVVVSLFVGLHPNVAAMTCPAGVVEGKIAVLLDAPVGDRVVEVVLPE